MIGSKKGVIDWLRPGYTPRRLSRHRAADVWCDVCHRVIFPGAAILSGPHAKKIVHLECGRPPGSVLRAPEGFRVEVTEVRGVHGDVYCAEPSCDFGRKIANLAAGKRLAAGHALSTGHTVILLHESNRSLEFSRVAK